MTQVQWLALVALPAMIALLGYIGVRVFEYTHPLPPQAAPDTGPQTRVHEAFVAAAHDLERASPQEKSPMGTLAKKTN